VTLEPGDSLLSVARIVETEEQQSASNPPLPPPSA
jgi:hypothetical protein